MDTTSIAMRIEHKPKFDKFCSEWGKHGESDSDVIMRMVNIIQKMNEKIDRESK